MTTRRPTAVLAAALGVLLGGTIAAAADPATTCRTSKMIAAGVYDSCLLRADARAARSGNAPDHSRCNARYNASWARAESRAAGACPTTGDAASIAGIVQVEVSVVESALNPSATTTTTPTPSTTSSTIAGGPSCGTFPGCGGACPAGQSCSATVGPGPTTACTCFAATATPCGSTGGNIGGGPKCGGACPAGEVCATTQLDESLNFTCGCITAGSTPCLSFGGPCGGACPTGMSCVPGVLMACECQ